jgi:hypothetical protein
VSRDVKLDVARRQRLIDRRGPRRAPQHSADPGDQLARVEGFRHVVIGSQLEADDAIGVVHARGEHDDRHLTLTPQFLRNFQAINARQHQVKDDQVGLLPTRLDQCCLAVFRCDNRVPGLLQVRSHELDDFRLVIYHQDFRGHRSTPPSGSRPLLLDPIRTSGAIMLRAPLRPDAATL